MLWGFLEFIDEWKIQKFLNSFCNWNSYIHASNYTIPKSPLFLFTEARLFQSSSTGAKMGHESVAFRAYPFFKCSNLWSELIILLVKFSHCSLYCNVKTWVDDSCDLWSPSVEYPFCNFQLKSHQLLCIFRKTFNFHPTPSSST